MRHVRLAKITLLAAYADDEALPGGLDAMLEQAADGFAEALRDNAETVCSEYDTGEADVDEDKDDDALINALIAFDNASELRALAELVARGNTEIDVLEEAAVRVLAGGKAIAE